MTDTKSTKSNAFANGTNTSQGTTVGRPAEPVNLRVVQLADSEALYSYGPVLRRMAVGLIDEVGDLSLLCLEASPMLKHVPSPPVRLIKQTKRYHQPTYYSNFINREITVTAPRFGLFEKLRPLKQAKRIGEILAPYKPTLLHAMSERQTRLTQHLSQLLDIPYVVSLLSMQNSEVSAFDKRCGRILPCNSYLARQVRLNQPELADRIQLLPIGTHVSDQPCCFDHGQRQAQLFCCGRLEYRHGFPELINSLKRLSDMGYNFNMTLSGRGPAEHNLRRQVSELNLNQRVHFVPPIEMMLSASNAYKAVLQTVDIFIQPWPNIAWRTELLESMSVGNAVVVANGVKNDLVLEGKTALTIPFHNEQALTDKVEQLLKDREYARLLAQRSQTYLRKHFLASRMITRLAKAYREALQTKVNS
ncbi:MAG: glycosyltransferase family 4 protein [Sedimentisphaerales bacterium]|nr:glycosyltransferase family 4 protein [Sedimentisphaerales bacterium]